MWLGKYDRDLIEKVLKRFRGHVTVDRRRVSVLVYTFPDPWPFCKGQGTTAYLQALRYISETWPTGVGGVLIIVYTDRELAFTSEHVCKIVLREWLPGSFMDVNERENSLLELFVGERDSRE